MGNRRGHERPATRMASDEPFGREPLHRVSSRHATDPELGNELGVGRQTIAGSERRDPLPEDLFDPAVMGDVAGVDHAGPRAGVDAAGASAAAATDGATDGAALAHASSAPWIA